MNWVWILILILAATGLCLLVLDVRQRWLNQRLETADCNAGGELAKAQQQYDDIHSDKTMAQQEMTLTIWRWSADTNLMTLKEVGIFQQDGCYASAERGDFSPISPESYVEKLVHPDDQKSLLTAFYDLVENRDWQMNLRFRARLLRDVNQLEWNHCFAIATERDANGRALAIYGSSEVVSETRQLGASLYEINQWQMKARNNYHLVEEDILCQMAIPIRHLMETVRKYVSSADQDERAVLGQRMEASKKHCQQMFDDLKMLTGLESGLWTANELECSLDDIIQASVQMLQQSTQMDKPAIKITTSCPEPPVTAVFDMNALMVVLNHLLMNAYKFSDGGLITVGYGHTADGRLRFFVSDEGCGIRDDQKEKVFDLFFKGDPAQSGLGIGLHLAAVLVQRMNGTAAKHLPEPAIGFDSTVGKGSTFWFYLPNVAK